jgi:putative SOS response-associated peptidase YedK
LPDEVPSCNKGLARHREPLHFVRSALDSRNRSTDAAPFAVRGTTGKIDARGAIGREALDAATVASGAGIKPGEARGRCIVPASGNYGWQATAAGKQPY